MDKKIKIFSGIAASLAFGAFIFYIKEGSKPTKRKLYDAIRDILEQIDAIVDEYPEDQRAANISRDKEAFIKLIQEAQEEFFDIASIDEELKQIPQFLKKHEYQIQLFNFEYVSFYLRKQSLETLNYVIQSIVKNAQLEAQQYNLTDNAKLFKDFIFVYLNVVFEELETIMPDESKKNKLILINVMANGFFIYLQSILKNAPSLRGLLAEALLTPVNFKYGHDCADTFHQKPVTEPKSVDCQCCLFDIMTRYCSVLTPTLQKLIVAIIVEYQVFNTYEHLTQVGSILMKNAFYLNSQISFNSMYYVAEASPFTTLLVFALSHQKVRVKICYSGNQLQTQLLYLERVINQNNPQFLTKLQPSFIHTHSSLYTIFSDPICLKTLFRNEKLAFELIIHFLGILLILETRDTVLIDQVQDFNLIDWLALNVGPLMAQETIGFLQLQFIISLLKNGPQDQVREPFFKAFLQCLRVTQNSRIKKRLEQIKQLDICTGLTKIFAPILLTQLQFNPSRKDIKELLKILPFQDKAELQNIFTNISRILIDLPTMNLYFLKFLGPKCKEISQDSEVVCRGYQAHVISALTLSFDTHMVTLQLGVLFGSLDQLLSDLTTRCQRDLGNYESLKNFLKRDIVLMLDLMENPYYYYNILAFLKTNNPEFKQLEKSLLQRATISIIKLNGPITAASLLDTLGSFVYLQELPDCIKQILDPAPNQKFNLLPQYADNYPYLVLQRDYESAEMFLENVKGDQFDEMMYCPDNIQFLKDIRRRFFKSQNFLNFIDALVKFTEADDLQVWTSKFLYYGKQTLLNQKKQNKNLEDLFQSDGVQQFISKIKSEKLVKYLSS